MLAVAGFHVFGDGGANMEMPTPNSVQLAAASCWDAFTSQTLDACLEISRISMNGDLIQPSPDLHPYTGMHLEDPFSPTV